jgi:1-deoxy-D-xylulose-5-phosphate synthase
VTALLPNIGSPKDVRALRAEELPLLCTELRAKIVEVCGLVGGHLGASLGAVELIVALHRVYSTPHDSIVFDVGHQAYAHKLLTGRQRRFHTLRQPGGIAPFLDPKESEHDAFGAGHAGTALSIALGLVAGQRQVGSTGRVVAVVGDGAMTAGLSFEGLNNVAMSPSPLCVVLNDNEMSISTNVGAIASLLKTDARRFFEALGLNYFGPLDGHDLALLDRTLRLAKQSQRSSLVHVKTEKGRGFAPAELDLRTRGHAMGPFELRDFKLVRSRQGRQTYSEAFAAALDDAMAADSRVLVATPAMIEGSALVELQRKYPTRVFDVGIAEQHALAWAAGVAKAGARPVVCIYSTFLQRAFDQLIHDLALPQLPVVLAVDRAGLVGADGATHQGSFDIIMARTVPHVTIEAPIWTEDLTTSLSTALQRPGPSIIRFPRGTILPSPSSLESTATWEPSGVRFHQRVQQPQLTLAAFGPCAMTALLAAKDQPWNVVEMRRLPALPDAIKELIAPALVTIEEGTTAGGFGSAVLEGLATLSRCPKVKRLGMPEHTFVAHGEAHAQRSQLGLDAEGIRRAALELIVSLSGA